MSRYTSMPGALFRRWRHYRNIHWELSQFNDRELRDLGIVETTSTMSLVSPPLKQFRTAETIHEQKLERCGNVRWQLVRGCRSVSSQTVIARTADGALARFPARWNHLAEKESRQVNMLEQILVGEVMQLRRDLL